MLLTNAQLDVAAQLHVGAGECGALVGRDLQAAAERQRQTARDRHAPPDPDAVSSAHARRIPAPARLVAGSLA